MKSDFFNSPNGFTINYGPEFEGLPQQENPYSHYTREYSKPKTELKLDARKIAGALTHRDYVNQLMGF